MKDPTPRQSEILDFIKCFLAKNQNTPTIRDIAGYFGFSVKAAQDQIRALEIKGHISRNYKGGRYKLANYNITIQKK